MAPLLVLSIVNMGHQVFEVHVKVPIYHILAHIVLFLVVVAQSLVPALLNIKLVHSVVAAYDLFQLISLLKAETIKSN